MGTKLVNGRPVATDAADDAQAAIDAADQAAANVARSAAAPLPSNAEITALTKAVRALAKGQAVPKAVTDVLDAIDAKR